MNQKIKNLYINYISKITNYYVPEYLIWSIDVEPIATCNLKCGFCQVPGWERARTTNPMKLETYKNVIDKFKYLKFVKIQGMGEPFLNRKIAEMVSYTTSKNIKSHINSNGVLLTEELSKRLIDAKLTELNISFDGGRKETYEKARDGANFEKVIKNIKTLVELKNENKAKLIIGMTCLISSPQILKELPDLIEICNYTGVESLHVKSRLKNWLKYDNNSYSFTVKNTDEYELYNEIRDNSIKLAKKSKLNFTIGNSDDLYSNDKPCEWPWRSVYVSTEGFIVPCCVNAMPETWEMGSINENSVGKIWNSKKYRNLRKQLISNDKPETCISCYK